VYKQKPISDTNSLITLSPSVLESQSPVLPLRFAPHNIARFAYKEKQFKFDPMVDQTMVHFSSDGWMLHKESEEARRQLELERQEADARVSINGEKLFVGCCDWTVP
jgi:hypothetical protein